MEKVGANQNKVLQDFQQQRASLADLQKSRQTDLAALEKKQSDLAALKAGSDKKLTEAKAVLAKLTTEQQQTLANQDQKQTEDAQTLAESALGTTPATTADTAGSAKGQTALAWARKQLGKPYVFGATGPNSFDCSGLTLGAWKAAGVSINRTSQAQFRNGKAVSKSELQPGDLVFYYSGISHVAMYVGKGMVIHAPHPGSSVKYAKLDSMPFAGARRPA